MPRWGGSGVGGRVLHRGQPPQQNGRRALARGCGGQQQLTSPDQLNGAGLGGSPLSEQTLCKYSLSDTNIRNTEFDSLLEVRSSENSNSNDDRQNVVS